MGSSALVALALATVQPAARDTTESLCLEALGGVAAITAQNTHLLLGVTADALRQRAQSSERTAQIARGAALQFETVVSQLRRLQQRKLASEDDEFVDGLIKVFRQIEDEARALETYANRGEASDQKAFDKARRNAAEGLDQLRSAGSDAQAAERPDERLRPKNGK